jgi:hypothetical protein
MWAQYADNHKGVCLVFERTKLHDFVKKQCDGFFAGPVEYRADNISLDTNNPFLIEFDILLMKGCERYFHDHVTEHNRALFFRKSTDWSQEREWRWVLQCQTSQDHFVNFGDSLEGIAIGWRTPAQSIKEISLATKDNHLQLAHLSWRNGFPQPLPLDVFTPMK